MTEDQKQTLFNAMYHLEMVEECRYPGLNVARAHAALYLVQKALNPSFEPDNFDEIVKFPDILEIGFTERKIYA